MNWGMLDSAILDANYPDFCSYLRGFSNDLVVALDPAVVTVANPPTGALRFNSAAFLWERYSGSAWAPAAATYSINVSHLGGTAAADYARLNSPALTGTPTAPTPDPAANNTQIATMAAVKTAIAGLVASAPGTLDTLNELATALGNDPSFATTITTNLAAKAPLASPALTGTPTAPTAAYNTNTTQLATTAHVYAATLATNLLAKLKTVDGAGSGLDADLLAGQAANAFVQRVTAGGINGSSRLVRRDGNDYSVQPSWDGTYWLLQGYNAADAYHAPVRVARADNATAADDAAKLGGIAAGEFSRFGVGQTWQSVIRNNNVTYTNSTGKQIMLLVNWGSANGNPGTVTCFINGSTVYATVESGDTSLNNIVPLIIPAGATYKISIGGAGAYAAHELR